MQRFAVFPVTETKVAVPVYADTYLCTLPVKNSLAFGNLKTAEGFADSLIMGFELP